MIVTVEDDNEEMEMWAICEYCNMPAGDQFVMDGEARYVCGNHLTDLIIEMTQELLGVKR